MKKKRTIVLTAGGTGGHVFPAEALASQLLNQDEFSLAFITDRRVKNLPPKLSQLSLHYVAAAAVTGKSLFQKFKAAFLLFWGTIQSIFLLVRIKPALVVGFGGYASIPATLAAQFLHIPVVLHEQNAILGRANRLLARKTRLIATSFTPTLQIPSGIETVQTGMPVRASIIECADSVYTPHTTEFNLMIMGGSQGAHAFSELVPKALVMLSPEIKAKLNVVQQVRSEDIEHVKEEYRNSGIKSILIAPFFDNIPDLLKKSHLVISRSGSSSLAEFTTIGCPALLIPLPTAADDHQTQNARVWTSNGGGWLMVERETTPEMLALRLTELIDNPDILARAALCAKQNTNCIAAKELAKAVLKIVSKKK